MEAQLKERGGGSFFFFFFLKNTKNEKLTIFLMKM